MDQSDLSRRCGGDQRLHLRGVRMCGSVITPDAAADANPLVAELELASFAKIEQRPAGTLLVGVAADQDRRTPVLGEYATILDASTTGHHPARAHDDRRPLECPGQDPCA